MLFYYYQPIMKFTSSLFCIFFAINLIAQYRHDYIWIVGNPVEDTTSNNGINVFNFNGNKLEINKQSKGLGMYVSNASISNDDGQLLFYSNGCKINNTLHETMLGGFGLNPGLPYTSGNCPDYGNSSINGLMILPLPNSSTKYFIFHIAPTVNPIIGVYTDKLYYTIVDMALDNGLGQVIDKNHIVLKDTLFTDMHAVKHANGQDWWVMVSKEHKNLFFKVLYTAEGVSSIQQQDIGIDIDPFSSGGGQARFSPDGTKYARYHKRNQVTLFDFDRATGELSNFQQLYADTTEGQFGGLAFSSNSRFLYASTQFKLFQFDLVAPDIQASKVLIDEWDGFTTPGGFPVHLFMMQLAPDCKIYMIPVNGSKYMHVINKPDEPGLACDFRQRGLVLPAINNTSIPNFPNYRLGTGYPVCDSNIVYVSGTGFVPPPAQGVRVWPNPTSHQVTVALSAPLPAAAAWSLHDALGRELSRAVLPSGQQEVVVGLATVPPGLYFWNLDSGGRKIGSGKLVVTK